MASETHKSETHKKVEWEMEITASPGVFGYVLIFFGIVLFLQNFGWLDFSWSDFWRLWPLLLVFCGIAVIPMKKWLKQVLAILCVIGALFILLKTPNFEDGYALYPNGETELNVCEKTCEKSKDEEVTVAPLEIKPVVQQPTARPARPVVPPPPSPVTVDSTLILDVSLENLTDGLVDRSPHQQTFAGGTSGVFVYREGGLVPNRRGGIAPKWTFNRPLANLRIEFDVKLLSRPHIHGTILSFSRDPEQDHIPRIFLSVHGQNMIETLFTDMRRTPSVPLNVWTTLRIDIGDRVDERVDMRVYFDDILQFSGNSNMVAGRLQMNYSNYVFSYITIGHDFGFANHDRADAVIRNLRVWVTK